MNTTSKTGRQATVLPFLFPLSPPPASPSKTRVAVFAMFMDEWRPELSRLAPTELDLRV